jgi:hypothetical protein
MAEIMMLPGYKQMALLRRQKFPKAGRGKFIVPYYRPALAGIRAALSSANPAAAISLAESKAQGLGNASRRENVIRALESFRKSDQFGRALSIEKNKKTQIAVGSVELRASLDLFASDEKGRLIAIYYNWGSVGIDQEMAKRLLEIAHWIYAESGNQMSERQFELFDLATGTLHQIKKRRSSTIEQVKDTAKMIESVWDVLEPPNEEEG